MAEVSPPQYRTVHIRNVPVPVRDGTRLAADLFVPEPVAHLIERGNGHQVILPISPASSEAAPEGRRGASADAAPEVAETGPGASCPPERFPALLEYLPYRKDDLTSPRWDAHHYFAARGYVGVRLDVRGTGDSPGVARDEYTLQEQLDGYDAIEWLAAQPWCNGRVGMWGTSYGGFNSIQVAMHRPPSLKAIVSHAATDDRYNDDVHYHGGCLTALEQVEYPLAMVAMNALPPDPELAGPQWQAIWRERLQATPWMLEWLRHQTNDDYWRHGSLCTNYAAIRCAVFHIGGWNDGYTNAVFRMAEHLRVPYKALVGPWTHSRPNVCGVGPRVDFLYEMLRWWDYWLKDIDTGIMDEPPITLYVQRWRPPERFPKGVPGYWRYEREWPPRRTRTLTLYLATGGALTDEPGKGQDTYTYDPTVGTTAGDWCPTEPPSGLAGDQRTDDALSLTYDTPPLAAPLEILGTPAVVLFVSSTAPVAFFSARLCDVAPDGRSTLITRGALNATRRRSSQVPEPLRPGEVYELMIPLRVISWVLPAGHRLRLSVASADWPMIWPSPYPAEQSVYYGRATPSRLSLPTVPVEPPPAGEPAPRLRPAADLPPTARVSAGPGRREIIYDELAGAVAVRLGTSSTVAPLGQSVALESKLEAEARVMRSDPAHAEVKGVRRYVLEQAGVKTEAVARAEIRSTVDELQVAIELDVTQEGVVYLRRRWRESIPRHLL
jgi:putative CocE/NonD family hydrolase